MTFVLLLPEYLKDSQQKTSLAAPRFQISSTRFESFLSQRVASRPRRRLSLPRAPRVEVVFLRQPRIGQPSCIPLDYAFRRDTYPSHSYRDIAGWQPAPR